MNTEVVLVGCEAGDWEAVFVNGTNHAENHSVPTYVVLDLLVGKTLTKYEVRTVKDEWLEPRGSFGAFDLDDIPQEAYL